MINLYRSIFIWDHYPTNDEIREKIDDRSEAQVVWRTVLEDKLDLVLSLYGARIYYNGSSIKPRYKTEIIWYYPGGGRRRIICQLNEDTPIFLL